MSEGATTKVQPALKLNFLSHGTLELRDLEASKKFYEEFLGLEVVYMSKIALCIRLGGNHTIVVVRTNSRGELPFINHNGLDVGSEAEVDAAHRIVTEQKDKWGLHKITPPKAQHGAYSFYFWDADDNCWEILANPPTGYSVLFDKAPLD